MKLKMAAKVDPVDQAYFDTVVKPLIEKSPHVEFIGEINDSQKQEFLGNAKALLFPISWPEPFGLVMIESLACGTPVVAFNCGSVPEIMEDGLTGFVVKDVAGAAAAVGRLDELYRPAHPRPFRGTLQRPGDGAGLSQDLRAAWRRRKSRPARPPEIYRPDNR